MNNNTTTASSGGIGFFGLLTIVFIVLRLMGIIEWGWVWVLAPLWMPLALVLVGVIIFLIVAAIASNNRKRRWRRNRLNRSRTDHLNSRW